MILITRIKDCIKISLKTNRHVKCTIAFSKFEYVEYYFVPNRKILDIKKSKLCNKFHTRQSLKNKV